MKRHRTRQQPVVPPTGTGIGLIPAQCPVPMRGHTRRASDARLLVLADWTTGRMPACMATPVLGARKFVAQGVSCSQGTSLQVLSAEVPVSLLASERRLTIEQP